MMQRLSGLRPVNDVQATEANSRAAHKVYARFYTHKKEQFLAMLAEGHTVAHAARACDVTRDTAYKARAADPDFADAWNIALEDGVQVLEEEARRRAVDGVTKEKGIYHQGVQVGTETITEYSDTLLIFLLKAKRPEVYRDRTEVKHTGQVNHAHAHLDLSAAPTDDLKAFVDHGRRLLDALPESRADPR